MGKRGTDAPLGHPIIGLVEIQELSHDIFLVLVPLLFVTTLVCNLCVALFSFSSFSPRYYVVNRRTMEFVYRLMANLAFMTAR